MLRVWVFILCLMGLGAHPFASYLDGPFASFGMDVGGGSIAHEYLYNPPINAVKEQAYQTELKAYNVAVAKLKTDQGQTINTLKTIAGILSHFTLTSTKATALLANLNALDTNNQTPSAINKSVQEYEAYLQKILEEYSNANQDKINQAENALSKYVQEISNYENTINSQPSGQLLKVLQNSITFLESLNTEIAQVAKDLGMSFTPFALPAPLNANGSNINTLSKTQIQTALNALSNELGTVISMASGDIQKLSAKNKKISIENLNQYSKLYAEKQEAISQALNKIVGVSQTVGGDFHDFWVNYADGLVFGVNNADIKSMRTKINGRWVDIHIPNGKYTYDSKTYDYINNAWNCTFAPIVRSAGTYSGYIQPSNCGPSQIGVPSELKDLGLTAYNIWNTLFNVSELQKGIPAILNSNCAGHALTSWGYADRGQCGTMWDNYEVAQKDMNTFFNFMNDYIGNGTPQAYGFDGNFKNSQIYQDFQTDLNNSNTAAGIAAAQKLLTGYEQGILEMLNAFQKNPIWIMSAVPNGASFDKDQGNTPPNVQYCYAAAGQDAGLGFPFNNGVLNTMCGANTTWANSIFVGYFGFTPSAVSNIESQIQSAAASVQTAFNGLSQANKNLENFTPTKTFPIPAFSSPPSIPLKGTPPLPPLPLRPIISTSSAPMPTINAPNKPALIFASGNLRANSLQLGLQAQGGYQKYFTPFFGVSTYGYFAYRYLYMGGSMSSQTNLSGLNRYSLGFGANLLTNFYSKIQKTGHGRTKIQTYGLFAGLLALGNVWNAYILQAPMQTRFNFNVDGVFGLSVRLNRFKWSLGVHVPLVGQTQMIKVHTKEGFHEELQLIDNYKSSQLFLNFTQIF
ncbi:outer membrane beta-barrel protein [Helicobacter ailurogastricus]|uniref:outer membrane beta-barrel protein n=1 Tax=Helicobacter ailurogastricus TaxID=1578720 RepID=UPI0025555E04|nr:outer membrane beta-barrel protein [Helicobacter ailurogastricus]